MADFVTKEITRQFFLRGSELVGEIKQIQKTVGQNKLIREQIGVVGMAESGPLASMITHILLSSLGP